MYQKERVTTQTGAIVVDNSYTANKIILYYFIVPFTRLQRKKKYFEDNKIMPLLAYKHLTIKRFLRLLQCYRFQCNYYNRLTADEKRQHEGLMPCNNMAGQYLTIVCFIYSFLKIVKRKITQI